MRINPAQRRALEWGESGFTRLNKLSVDDRETGVTTYTVAGLIRRGWLWENSNGIIRISVEGRKILDKVRQR